MVRNRTRRGGGWLSFGKKKETNVERKARIAKFEEEQQKELEKIVAKLQKDQEAEEKEELAKPPPLHRPVHANPRPTAHLQHQYWKYELPQRAALIETGDLDFINEDCLVIQYLSNEFKERKGIKPCKGMVHYGGKRKTKTRKTRRKH